ncbi:radical SAM protein [candidate division KSB1 bacterium]
MSRAALLKYKFNNGAKAFRRWIIPYSMSLVYNNQFRPVLSYLFTDWRCNINCHYCFQFDNVGNYMSLDTAISSIDWLKSLGCRVIAIMGGEPSIRKDFILKVIEYGSENNFFMYFPTNGYLLTEDFIDKLGKAKVATINLAVDCIEPKPGLPKALMPIEPQFRYLVKQQRRYGYIIFFNINITSENIKEVKMLTEIAHENGLATDYHINQRPQQVADSNHFKYNDKDLYIKPEQYDEAEELLDWIIMKIRRGHTVINSISHLIAMKNQIKSIPTQWDCRAGHNGLLIKPDGTLSPCFDLISYDYDWGRIWHPKFNQDELTNIKSKCRDHCLSTCFFTMGHYYQIFESLKWMFKHSNVGSIR